MPPNEDRATKNPTLNSGIFVEFFESFVGALLGEP